MRIFYVRDEYWPDFDPLHSEHTLAWFKNQDRTLGSEQQWGEPAETWGK
jgi:hypothetical protein